MGPKGNGQVKSLVSTMLHWL